MEKEFDKEMNEDFDDDNEVDVEWFPIPDGLKDAWNEIIIEESRNIK